MAEIAILTITTYARPAQPGFAARPQQVMHLEANSNQRARYLFANFTEWTDADEVEMCLGPNLEQRFTWMRSVFESPLMVLNNIGIIAAIATLAWGWRLLETLNLGVFP